MNPHICLTNNNNLYNISSEAPKGIIVNSKWQISKHVSNWTVKKKPCFGVIWLGVNIVFTERYYQMPQYCCSKRSKSLDLFAVVIFFRTCVYKLYFKIYIYTNYIFHFDTEFNGTFYNIFNDDSDLFAFHTYLLTSSNPANSFKTKVMLT